MRALIAVSSAWLCLACSATPLSGVEDDFTRGVAGSKAPPSTPSAGATGGSAGRPMNMPPSRMMTDPGPPVPPTAGSTASPISFFAQVVEEGRVVLEARSAQPLYMLSCSYLALERFDGGTWTALRDDRPPSPNNPGYYLDGTFVPPSYDEGCDVLACVPMPPQAEVGYALEYYKLGSMDPPAGSGVEHPVAVIESRGVRGDLRVRVTYSQESNCAVFHERTVDFNVPQGVCCPIEGEGCTNYGWRGGWAPADNWCRFSNSTFERYMRLRQDGWGCQTLIPDPNICCGDCDPEDAGVAP